MGWLVKLTMQVSSVYLIFSKTKCQILILPENNTVKVKVKFTLEQATKAQTGSKV
jgi:hypothetical protein